MPCSKKENSKKKLEINIFWGKKGVKWQWQSRCWMETEMDGDWCGVTSHPVQCVTSIIIGADKSLFRWLEGGGGMTVTPSTSATVSRHAVIANIVTHERHVQSMAHCSCLFIHLFIWLLVSTYTTLFGISNVIYSRGKDYNLFIYLLSYLLTYLLTYLLNLFFFILICFNFFFFLLYFCF